MLHDENLSKLKRAPIETYIVTLWLVFAMFGELRKGNSGGGAVSRTRLFMEIEEQKICARFVWNETQERSRKNYF